MLVEHIKRGERNKLRAKVKIFDNTKLSPKGLSNCYLTSNVLLRGIIRVTLQLSSQF